MSIETTGATSDTWAHDHIADSQTCPVCFAPVAGHETREVRDVVLAEYTCGGTFAHRWNLSWVLAQAVAR